MTGATLPGRWTSSRLMYLIDRGRHSGTRKLAGVACDLSPGSRTCAPGLQRPPALPLNNNTICANIPLLWTSVSPYENQNCCHLPQEVMEKVKDWGGFSIACRGATLACVTVSSSSPRILLIKTHPWLPLPVRRPHLLQADPVLTRPHLSLDLDIPGFDYIPIKLWACHTGSLAVHFPTSPQEGKFRDMEP